MTSQKSLCQKELRKMKNEFYLAESKKMVGLFNSDPRSFYENVKNFIQNEVKSNLPKKDLSNPIWPL